MSKIRVSIRESMNEMCVIRKTYDDGARQVLRIIRPCIFAQNRRIHFETELGWSGLEMGVFWGGGLDLGGWLWDDDEKTFTNHNPSSSVQKANRQEPKRLNS